MNILEHKPALTSQWAKCADPRWSICRGRWGSCGTRRRRASEKEGRCFYWCGRSRVHQTWARYPEGPAAIAACQSNVPLGRAHKTGWQLHKPVSTKHPHKPPAGNAVYVLKRHSGYFSPLKMRHPQYRFKKCTYQSSERDIMQIYASLLC